MENGLQALKTAAAVLIFVIAISTSFVMFSRVKATTDSILKFQDRQAYLESDDVDNGILYTSSSAIESEAEGGGQSKIPNMTTDGYRLVGIDDIESTIFRYTKEKYGVTIIKNKKVITRFDTNTENVARQYDTLKTITEIEQNDGSIITGEELLKKYQEQISDNIKVKINGDTIKPDVNIDSLYKIEKQKNVDGDWIKEKEVHGAPWLTSDLETRFRIYAELSGVRYEFDDNYNKEVRQVYNDELANKINIRYLIQNERVIEIVNKIEHNKYLKENDDTNTSILTEYQMPTIEIIYVIM